MFVPSQSSARPRATWRVSAIGLLVAIATSGRLDAVEPNAPPIDFVRDVRPILSDACFHCHGPDGNQREAELRLDRKSGLFQSRDGVTIVVPGSVEKSELTRRIHSTGDDRMPPADSNPSLTAEQIRVLTRWIEQGAKWRGHWAFEVPKRTSPPKSQTTSPSWPRNAIDVFAAAKMREHSLSPNPQATRERLLRRVTLDLTGLPPTIAELDRYLRDESPGAYERAVDRLLASPRYGERMAWDWLDAGRYADSNGFQGDRERTMWPWRDWVVRTLNTNLPYDEFTVRQLAGDLLPEEDRTDDTHLATGFCRNHMINGEGGRIPEENRVEYIFDQVETVGTVWLGLTVTCCRCHDHKYDPLTQRDYYGLFDFFNQTPVNGGGGDPQTPPVMSVASDDQKLRLATLDNQRRTQSAALKEIESKLFPREDDDPAGESQTNMDVPENVKQALNRSPADRDAKQLTLLRDHFKETQAEYAGRLDKLRGVVDEADRMRRSFPKVMVMADRKDRRQTFVLTKGLYNQRGDVVEARLPEVLASQPVASGTRLALAEWLVADDNPLVARVTVNRIWQSFFGRGLVETIEDFGSQGAQPSHGELLDWLAVEFVESNWNVKTLHRLIVTSAVYRQSAKRNGDADPANRFLSRGPRSRMPAWMIRDHALAASGLLVENLGGAPVRPYQPPGVWSEATFGNKKYSQDHGIKLYRRSLYTFWRRIVGPTMFFDAAKRQTCSVRATRTNTPLHALTTFNGTTFIESSRVLAQRLLQDEHDEITRITRAFRLLTSRRPHAVELDILAKRLERLRQTYSADASGVTELLAVGESRRDDTLDATEHAAYTSLCLLILNLDESLSR